MVPSQIVRPGVRGDCLYRAYIPMNWASPSTWSFIAVSSWALVGPGCRARGVLLGCPFEQVVDLRVRCLREVVVPEPDAEKGLRRAYTNNLIDLVLELRAGL